MASVVIAGDTSGTVTLAAPAVSGSNTITLPAGTGTMTVAGVNSNIVSGTAVASTSGTSIDFTGIPSWVKRITVMLNGVSTNGTSNYLVQIGAGSITATGYASAASGMDTGVASSTYTTGFGIRVGVAAAVSSGSMVLNLIGSNVWSSNHTVVNSNSASSFIGGGSITLGGTLDRVRITTVNGTDAFDAGSVNILYE